jgi:hypothetical protein
VDTQHVGLGWRMEWRSLWSQIIICIRNNISNSVD